MPVLLKKDSDSTDNVMVFSCPTKSDANGSNVVVSDGYGDQVSRERLCPKPHHERSLLCSTRRSAPYYLNKSRRPSLHEDCCEQCRHKHHSSPNPYQYHQHGQSSSEAERYTSSNYLKPIDPCKNRRQCSSKLHPTFYCQERRGRGSKKDNVQDARTVLEQLLSEQSLIQEAVRRLKVRNSQEQSMCSAQKLFSLMQLSDHNVVTDEDSNDQFSVSASSRQTPFSITMSESEDDSVSQHSVDL